MTNLTIEVLRKIIEHVEYTIEVDNKKDIFKLDFSIPSSLD